jgi:hypothetical protein
MMVLARHRRLPRKSDAGRAGTSTRAVDRRVALVILAVGAWLGLATNTATAEGTGTETGLSEARGSEAQAARQESASLESSSNPRALRHRRQAEWWSYTREVLFADLDLSAEQTHEVEALIEAQLSSRARYQVRDIELRAARQERDTERSAALRAELRELDAQLKERHELIEAMRALLTEEQRPTFDMNRARLVAEGQKARKGKRSERSEDRVNVDTE